MNGVSVIICTFNGGPRLAKTLGHLGNQNISADMNAEVIVVDNASTDDTAEVAKKIGSSFVSDIEFNFYSQPKPGKKYALELAIEKAKNDVLIVCDDDNWLEENYLSISWEIMVNKPEIGILGGVNTAVFEGTEPPWFKMIEQTYAVGENNFPNGDITDTRGRVFGAGMVFRKKIWTDLYSQGFSSLLMDRVGKSLTTGSDTEMCWMAKLLGYRLFYDDRLKLMHFMTSDRLDWAYCRRLQRGIGQSLGRLSIYDYLWIKYKQQPVPPVDKYYMDQVIKNMKMLLSSPKRLFRFMFMDIEGEYYFINYEYAYGSLKGLFELWGIYSRTIDRLTTLFKLDQFEKHN